MNGRIDIVLGTALERTDADVLIGRAQAARSVVVDVGTGDGKALYRHARAHPGAFCIGIDANPAVMGGVAFRASRKPARGGVPNIVFVRAALAELPGPLAGIADEIRVMYPWKTLLDAALGGADLRRIAAVGKAGSHLLVVMNASALSTPAVEHALRAAYDRAGAAVLRFDERVVEAATTWGARVAQGRNGRALVIEAEVRRTAHAWYTSADEKGATWNSTSARPASSRSTEPRST